MLVGWLCCAVENDNETLRRISDYDIIIFVLQALNGKETGQRTLT